MDSLELDQCLSDYLQSGSKRKLSSEKPAKPCKFISDMIRHELIVLGNPPLSTLIL